MQQIHITRFLQSATILIGLAACSADLGGPSPTIATSQLKAKSVEPVRNNLYIVDDDGTGYTLDVASQEIRMSDGRVLILDAEQTTDAIGAFSRTITTDPISYEVSQLTYIPDCGQVVCEYSSSPGQATGVLWRRSTSSDPGNRKGLDIGRRPSKPTGGPTTAQSSSDRCSEVASIAVSRAQEYANSRTSFIKSVWPFAVEEATNALKKFMPRGTSVAQYWADKIAQHYATSTAVGILAYTWNTYGCSDRRVTVGPVYMNSGGSGGGGGGGNYVCEDQRWEISFDGGQTWAPIWVKVCYYQMT